MRIVATSNLLRRSGLSPAGLKAVARTLSSVTACTLAIALAIGDIHSLAQDWPQILGPNRTGMAVGQSLPEQWPAAGPAVAWKWDCGAGYAGPVAVGQSVYLFHRVGNEEKLSAISLQTGTPEWEVPFNASYNGGINPDIGPRCTPVVYDNAIIVYGAAGNLSCVERKSGKLNWTRPLLQEYRGAEGYFGAGSTPIIAGEPNDPLVIVNVGGKMGGIVAVSLKSGKTVWTATKYEASYSAPIQFQFRGEECILVETRLNAVALKPLTGEIVFEVPFGQRGPTVNGAAPVQIDPDHLFLTASYGIGARLIDLSAKPPKAKYDTDDLISSQYATPVLYEGNLYGSDGREDMGLASLNCIDPLRQKVLWQESNFGVAHIIGAGNRLVISTIDGQLTLAEPSPVKFTAKSKYQLPEGTYRAIPALASGKLLIKGNTSDTKGQLIALDMMK